MFIDPPDDFDPDDLDGDDDIFDIDVQSRSEAMIEAAVEQYQRRIDREVYAAWMAGYDAVDILKPRMSMPHPGEDVFDPAARMRYKAIPRQSMESDPVTVQGFQTERFDLRSITPSIAAELRDRCRRR